MRSLCWPPSFPRSWYSLCVPLQCVCVCACCNACPHPCECVCRVSTEELSCGGGMWAVNKAFSCGVCAHSVASWSLLEIHSAMVKSVPPSFRRPSASPSFSHTLWELCNNRSCMRMTPAGGRFFFPQPDISRPSEDVFPHRERRTGGCYQAVSCRGEIKSSEKLHSPTFSLFSHIGHMWTCKRLDSSFVHTL